MGPSRSHLLAAACLTYCAAPRLPAQDKPRVDHVGQSVPDYMTGDECLFCHRGRTADTWQQTPHARTIRPVETDPASAKGFPSDATHILGAHPPYRALKLIAYGKFALYDNAKKSWDTNKFADRCAGCHATAVDPSSKAFSSFSIDCNTCHGDVPRKHANEGALAWLAKKHSKDPKDIVAICGQCHLRGGVAKSTGLPYPDNFDAGDQLFRDFRVDFSNATDGSLNTGDRHIYRVARDAMNGGDLSCIDCHFIHPDNEDRHALVPNGPVCLYCHNSTGPMNAVKKYTVHSPLCEY